MSIASDISDLKDLSDGVVANKVSRFAYTEQAYTDNDADGVTVYDVNNDQNIPVGTASVMKVNQTVIEKGWRARASSITRMLMNHFLGRISYNLNKVNDWFNDLLVSISSYLGQPDGIATLDSNGHLIQQSPVGSPYVPMTRAFLGAVFGRLIGNAWKQVEGSGGTSGFRTVYLAYHDGLWVLGAYNNYSSPSYPDMRRGCWWSEDGKTWVQGTGNNTNVHMYRPVYANGLWVANGSGGAPWWSEDGKYWVQGELLTEVASPNLRGNVVYANGIWNSKSGTGCWWSEDGKTWTQSSTDSGFTTRSVNELGYVHGKWFRTASNEYYIWCSEDGKTWTKGSGIDLDTTCRLPTYGNGLWILGSSAEGSGGQQSSYQGCWWSEDGLQSTQCSGITAVEALSPLYVEEKGIWVTSSFDGRGWVCWSEDGKAWTRLRLRGGELQTAITGNGIEYKFGIFLCACSNGCYWSEDGKVWTQCTLDGSAFDAECILRFGYINGVWLAELYYTKHIARSSNGKDWTSYTLPVEMLSYSSFSDEVLYKDGLLLGKLGLSSGIGGLWYSDIEALIEAGVVDLGADIPLVNS